MENTTHAHANRLIHETSPYLLQHAHNPVDWYPWGEEAFEKARTENKLVLVSVGYSSCHWCHVMERESFTNDSIAALMNERFVCIKVDREERPDVDQVYMTAVQLMTNRGGWPLNCFALPDGRPCYGGTYFPPDQWKQVLNDLSETWKREPQRVTQYAERLHEGVKEADLVTLNEAPVRFTRRDADAMIKAWEPHWDHEFGGPDQAPKFPMPNNYQFLLRYGRSAGHAATLKYVETSLDRMALGGLFDQVGGGFARYSTDLIWKVPHFEKMLYDNAQLLSLFSQAHQAFRKPLYADVVKRTFSFLEREMRAPDGLYYSALDADSEGEEGLFYTWTEAELQATLGEEYAIGKVWYQIGPKTLWEHDRHILLRTAAPEQAARALGMGTEALASAAERINARLLSARSKRIRPGLDDKRLTSWNGLMVTGLCDAYDALGDTAFLEAAVRCMDRLLTLCRRPDGGLLHSSKGERATINGYLEDYAFVIEGSIALYQVTFEERWLNEARKLTDHALAHFFDKSTLMFHFTSDQDPPLVARKMEVSDNVIPASNSAMARNLSALGSMLENETYRSFSEAMLHNVLPRMEGYPSGYSNWGILLLEQAYPVYEIAITGAEATRRRREFGAYYIPNRLYMGGTTHSTLPLLKDKFLGGTTIFVCENKVCQLPVTTVAEALKQIR
ncbi:MAG: thioredoxin domain-containing protein [Flavobacteriales bacterium]|nr:thioredoxin domain-containing protein [Flavobacteriales bacterium]